MKIDLVSWERRLYLTNAAVLFAHEVDSAYWREWELLGLTGGIQLFIVQNLLLFLVFIHGYHLLADRRTGGHGFSILLAGAGLVAVAVHGYFLANGRPEFTLPTSLFLLGATGVLSSGQVLVTALNWRSGHMQGRR